VKVGIIGLPMSGKSSLFRLLTGAEPDLARSGRVEQRQAKVHDPRLARLTEDFSPKKVTYPVIDFLDFPPIGNRTSGDKRSFAELLSPARDSDALVIVVRSFENPALPPMGGEIDPAADLAEVVDELRLADLEVATNRRERIEASISKKRGDEKKALEAEYPLIVMVIEQLEAEKDLLDLDLDRDAQRRLRGFQFLSAKPRLVVENQSEGQELRVEGAVSGCLALELDIAELDGEDRELFAAEYGLEGSCVDAVIGGIYRRARAISFLTAGEPEVRAWTIAEGSTAVEAAGAIHTDISRGFIRAEVVSYDDYVTDGGMAGAKEKGHFRLEGKEYSVQDGDIILFRFNV
jgi:GTP-binding protein YchF